MMGIIVSALLGGSGGYMGGQIIQSLMGLSTDGIDSIAAILGGILGGGVVGALVGRSRSNAPAVAAAGEANFKQIASGFAGGAGAGAIVQAMLGVIA